MLFLIENLVTKMNRKRTRQVFGSLRRQTQFLLLVFLLLRQGFSKRKRRCPEGCYSCVYDDEDGPDKTPTQSEKSSKSLKKLKATHRQYLRNRKLKCRGCWHDRLGTKGCPPKSVKQDKCLLYYGSGICMICEKGWVPKTFKDDGYLNSKCIKSAESSVVWGFFDHSSKRQFFRVCDGKFPVYGNTMCRKFGKGDFLSRNCLWGSGHRGCQKCFKCKKGFTSFFGVCRPSWKGIRGCIYSSEVGKCDYCDHWRGFYMHRPGHCAKYKKKKKRPQACLRKLFQVRKNVLMTYAMFD